MRVVDRVTFLVQERAAVAYPHPMLPRGAAALRRMKQRRRQNARSPHSWHGAPGHKGRRHKKFTKNVVAWSARGSPAPQ